jgi:hypothetical protein
MCRSFKNRAVLRIRCLFDPWIRDPGWVKNQDPDQDVHPGSYMYGATGADGKTVSQNGTIFPLYIFVKTIIFMTKISESRKLVLYSNMILMSRVYNNEKYQ